MSEESYFDSDEYQREIAAGYGERIASFSAAEVAQTLDVLGFSGVDPESIKLATGGNIHATYFTPELVIKLNQNQNEPSFFANKFIDQTFYGRTLQGRSE